MCSGDTSTWSEWSPWSSCSRTCDGGYQTRQRLCSSSAIGACGSGFGKEQQLCNQSACTDGANRAVRLITSSASSTSAAEQRRPEWSAWSSWSACSCYNNKQMRRRACLVYQPSILGFCLGPLVDYRPCVGNSGRDCSKSTARARSVYASIVQHRWPADGQTGRIGRPAPRTAAMTAIVCATACVRSRCRPIKVYIVTDNHSTSNLASLRKLCATVNTTACWSAQIHSQLQ